MLLIVNNLNYIDAGDFLSMVSEGTLEAMYVRDGLSIAGSC
jgi:hypothetical protein